MKLQPEPWIFNWWRFEFKPEDCWIGAFWKRTMEPLSETSDTRMETLDVWICLLPMVPLHLQYSRFWSGPATLFDAHIW